MRLGGVEHHIVQPVVAVHQAYHAIVFGHVLHQPGDEALHGLDTLGLGGAILLGPPVCLAGEVVSRATVVTQADRVHVHTVQCRHGLVHGVVDGGALGVILCLGYQRIPQDAAFHVLHDVEHGSDNALVLAQQVGARHGYVGVLQGGDYPVFPVHRMR